MNKENNGSNERKRKLARENVTLGHEAAAQGLFSKARTHFMLGWCAQHSIKKPSYSDRKNAANLLACRAAATLEDREYELAERIFETAITAFKELSKHSSKGNHEKSEEISQSQEEQDWQNIAIAVCKSRIAESYVKRNQYKVAIAHYDQALTILKSREISAEKDINEINDILIELGELYRQVGNFPKSLDVYQEALSRSAPTCQPTELQLIYCYRGLGLTYAELGEEANALASFKKEQAALLLIPEEKRDEFDKKVLASVEINIAMLESSLMSDNSSLTRKR